VRKKVSTKCTGAQWLEVMRIAHRQGISTTATMMYGIGEQLIHRFRHMQLIRDLQDETRGFISFIPWTFQPDNTPLGRKIPSRIKGDSYLRWLALSRLFLDNIPNVQVSWLTQGIEVGQKGLHCGANDLGSIMIEENVISAAGAHNQATELTLRQAILQAGFTPCKRNAGYLRLESPLPAGAPAVAGFPAATAPLQL
jgi:cyclic dehypoxanthinyl futalosine synthase